MNNPTIRQFNFFHRPILPILADYTVRQSKVYSALNVSLSRRYLVSPISVLGANLFTDFFYLFWRRAGQNFLKIRTWKKARLNGTVSKLPRIPTTSKWTSSFELWSWNIRILFTAVKVARCHWWPSDPEQGRDWRGHTWLEATDVGPQSGGESQTRGWGAPATGIGREASAVHSCLETATVAKERRTQQRVRHLATLAAMHYNAENIKRALGTWKLTFYCVRLGSIWLASVLVVVAVHLSHITFSQKMWRKSL